MHRELWGLLWTDNMYVMFECACILPQDWRLHRSWSHTKNSAALTPTKTPAQANSPSLWLQIRLTKQWEWLLFPLLIGFYSQFVLAIGIITARRTCKLEACQSNRLLEHTRMGKEMAKVRKTMYQSHWRQGEIMSAAGVASRGSPPLGRVFWRQFNSFMIYLTVLWVHIGQLCLKCQWITYDLLSWWKYYQ